MGSVFSVTRFCPESRRALTCHVIETKATQIHQRPSRRDHNPDLLEHQWTSKRLC
jgi:hypothetical protein